MTDRRDWKYYQLLHDDVSVKIVIAIACSRHMDVAIVLDMSGSNEQTFDAMFDFTRMLTLGLPVGSEATRVAIVTYSDTANVTFFLNEYSTSQQVNSLFVNRSCISKCRRGQLNC